MEIPAQIGNFTNMEYLSLSDNNFGGEIPSSMRKMGQLDILYLEDNLLTGEIPSWLFDLRNLHNLFLGGNKLVWKNASNIVPQSCMLYSLSLRSCSLSAFPIFISNSTNLELLDLSGNNLIGKFPKWLTKINISVLILSDNMLSGSLSPLLFQSTLLYLDLSRNNMSGRLPHNIGDAVCLIVLKLSVNDFSGPIPESISNISSQLVLDLSYNRLSGNKFPIFDTLYLDLSFNRFSGAIPATYSQKITVLLLSHNDFTSVMPQTLRNLTNLASIDFHDNNIRGEIPAFLSQISSLKILDFRNNFFQGQIPDGILSNLTSLQILDLSNNNFSGQIPPSLGKMLNPNPDTSFIYISGTVNSFPFSISHPDLEVYWKNLIRDLPSPHLSLYTFLDLSNNQLSGEIPDTLGDLKNLKVLNISHNQLSGRIPTSLGDMNNLESLDLSYNGLSGEIPQTFGKLLQLNNLELCNNKLTGRIPNGPQMDRLNNPQSFANNSGLCGMQIQVPCDTTKPWDSDENQEQGTWFSWVMAGIGFPSGFFSTVLVFYVIGYFDVVPKRRSQRRHVKRAI